MREHDDFDSDYDETEKLAGRDGTPRGSRGTRLLALGYFFLAFAGLVAVGTVLDPERPYHRAFTTLPLPLLAILAPEEKGGCQVSSSWPMPHLIEKIYWQTPNGDFKGWAPGTENNIIKTYKDRVPDWLPEDPPSGFTRWTHEAKENGLATSSNETEEEACPDPLALDPFYNPANDPLKISNLDSPFLEQLQDTIESNNVTIRHVAVVLMESMREELFPLQQGSDFHGLLMKSHDELDEDEVNALLAQVSQNAERITGRPGMWTYKNGSKIVLNDTEWENQTEAGYGGVNIIGGLTTASVSTKSLSSVHCGTWPMPVDMFEEAESESYQPCFPQVFEMLNRQKEDKNTTTFQEQQWYPAFFQAVTDGYDRQGQFDAQIGFKHMVTKTTIKEDSADDKDVEEVNYFGFPETALKRYLREYITNVTTNNQRMFLSHFTSTTHHPWVTPKWFETSEYMGEEHGLMQTHKELNDFLNSIRFTDVWLGTLMQILQETGVADETLVVFVGDHGQAFKEDFSKTGTYENPHISNFRVPIAFHHPKLPNVQHRVNATAVSILPTVLDLLINTGSLNDKDKAVASDLVHDYEGQSLVRPVTTAHKGRRAWNFGIVNPGGKHLTITSADTPYRLVLPLDKKTEYIFSDIGRDPLELERELEWSIKSLANTVRAKHGDDAADWVIEAEQVGLWWGAERKRLWHYKPS